MEEPQTETVVERTEAQLVELVKNQVEYYFSKENLQSDPFLSSQMDAQMCVPISVVMKFAKLKALTHDESILRKALVDSTAVSIVDNKIKANIKPPGRSTIILREIPSDAPVEEVKEIFNYPGAKPVSSIRSEIGDTWFVVMESEEDAKDTLLDLRLKKRTFRDVAVKGRLKTETVVRSFFPVQTSIAPVVPFPGIMGAGMPIPVVDMRAFGYMGMPVPVLAPVDGAVAEGASAEASPTAAPAAAEARSSPNKPAQNAAATTPNSGAKGGKGQGAGAGKGGDKGNNNNAEKGRRQDGGKDSGAANGRNGGKGAGKDKKEEPAPRKPSIDLNLASFPPLGAVDDTPVPTPGYKGPFIKYSGDDIIAIAKGVKEAKLPASLNPSLHPLAMTVEANKDLLKRQRTFSIDETREQLRQGRPVTRDAILPGKVDSRSLYYGDEAPAAGASTQPKKEAAPAAAPAAPVTSPSATKKGNETAAVASDVVEQVAADAANLALSNAPPVVEAMNASTPQKITPSTWAAMLKSSASAATVVETKPAAPAPVKRTPAKEGATKTAAAGSSSSAKPGKSGEGKEKEGEGKRRKGSEGSGRGKGESAPAKEGAQGSNSSDAADPTNSNRPEKGSDNTNTTTAKSTAAAEPAAATSSWGGKASFANILKLNADAEAFTPAATSPKPPASTAAPTTATSSGNKDKEGKDDRRRGPQSSSAPAKPSASAVAAASKREPKPAPAGDNEWSTSTGKGRNHNREHRENKEPREPRGEHREGRGEGREHRERDHHHRPGAGSGSTATTGANAKGVWARETLPPAATTAAEK